MSDTQSETRGAETLAAANLQAYEDVCDKRAAQSSVGRVELREAIATWIDHDLDTAVERHEVDRSTLVETNDAMERAAQNQYPQYY